MLGSFCCKLAALVCSLFGSLLIIANEGREHPDDQDYQTHAKSKIQLLFLIGNVLQVPFCLFFGYLSDRMKIWKLLVVNSVLCIGFIIMMLVWIEQNNAGMLIGFVGFYLFHYIVYMLVITVIF